MSPGPSAHKPIGTARRRILVYCGLAVLAYLATVWFNPHPEFRRSRTPSPDHRISAAQVQVQMKLQAGYGKLQLSFELNRGQGDAQVQILSGGREISLHNQCGVRSNHSRKETSHDEFT